jgi:nucleoside-diphosphate-sugar epimerase
MPAPRIIIAGATGYLGTRLRRRVESERIAGVVVRRLLPELPGVKWAIGPAGIEPIERETARDCVLFHFIGGGRGRRSRDLYDLNVRSTEMLCEFARATGVRRVIYMSGFGVGGETSSAYFQAKAEAEAVIKASGVDHAIMRCSYVLGGEDEFKPWLLSEIAGGVVHLPGGGEYRIQPVYIDDLMRCFLALAEKDGRLDQTYDFIGEPIAFKDFIARLLERIGAGARIEAAPIEPFVREAVVRPDPTFSLEELGILLCDIVGPWTADVAGARPRSADEAIAAIVAELPEEARRAMPETPAPLAQERRPGEDRAG